MLAFLKARRLKQKFPNTALSEGLLGNTIHSLTIIIPNMPFVPQCHQINCPGMGLWTLPINLRHSTSVAH